MVLYSTSGSGRRPVWIRMFPSLEKSFSLFYEVLRELARATELQGKAHPLLSPFCYMPVGFEERSDVQCLSTPDVTMHRPVQRQL